ncbi:MAG: hypothetical protein H0T76_00140 [Nannocystis sp.]|nr:hypothetical protein [Nannocystis sp.]MBA3544869.1 hypothetical protein [Nannocystis sp.]
MSLLTPFLMLTTLLLLSSGFALLWYRAAEEEAHEPSPADLSTSRPTRRPCWSRWCARGEPGARRHPRPRSPMVREAVFELAEVSAARTLLCGCIADL